MTPMDKALGPAEHDLAARHQAALDGERLAWDALEASRRVADSGGRAADFQRWVDANRDLREMQYLMTTVAVQSAKQSMRESVSILSSESTSLPEAHAQPAARRAVIGPPVAGQSFVGRGGSKWRVVDVTQDMLETGYYLAQMERREGGRLEELIDVYSDDWSLFCVVHGLHPAPGND